MSLLQVLRENLDARHLQCGQNLINTRMVLEKKGQSCDQNHLAGPSTSKSQLDIYLKESMQT
ncbi:hypothetical protein RHMOL_Rhmol11G0234700 [Rhododendron molle]|uniref:Uncharacterized protein n=1 Tax=Rhododendron molle TaxID=49168 RepID=A0ACC0LV67_RHOML|nr:hypothetical protein RHMOL_Rhmol11G0234700 [Rhododendron molle]